MKCTVFGFLCDGEVLRQDPHVPAPHLCFSVWTADIWHSHSEGGKRPVTEASIIYSLRTDPLIQMRRHHASGADDYVVPVVCAYANKNHSGSYERLAEYGSLGQGTPQRTFPEM